MYVSLGKSLSTIPWTMSVFLSCLRCIHGVTDASKHSTASVRLQAHKSQRTAQVHAAGSRGPLGHQAAREGKSLPTCQLQSRRLLFEDVQPLFANQDCLETVGHLQGILLRAKAFKAVELQQVQNQTPGVKFFTLTDRGLQFKRLHLVIHPQTWKREV